MRSYLSFEGLKEKTKVKSRPNGPAPEAIKGKKGFWSGLSKKEEKKQETKDEEEDVVPRGDWVVRMKEKSKMLLQQMIGTKEGTQPMKWDNFLKVGLFHGVHSRPRNSLDQDHEGDGLYDRP